MVNNLNKKNIKEVSEILLICLGVTFIFCFALMPIKVDGSSMYPTLQDHDYAFMSRLNLNQIERFDVVTLNCKKLGNIIIKRVIGLPGEKIVYKDDQLYVDDQKIAENFLDKNYIKKVKKEYNISCFTEDFEYTVGENEIFVLGDNRLNSLDSRLLGCFKEKDILSKKGIILFPFKNMKEVD